QAGGLGAQRDRREGATVVEEAADQLGGEVLCLGGAAAVARGEQPGARGEPVGQLPAPFLDSGGVPVEEVERGVQLRAVLVEPVPGGHAVTSRAWSAACRACGATTSTYADSVAVATCRQPHRAPAPARAAAPTAVRRPGSASSAVTAAASATGSRGGTSRPVRPSSTESSRPPTALPTSGRPQAAASNSTIPNGSYHGVATTTSAERMSAGMSVRGTEPTTCTRSATPSSAASACSRTASGSVWMRERTGPPATSSSASGSGGRAAMTVSTPLRSTRRPTESRRNGVVPRGGYRSPSGLKSRTSPPQGTVRQRAGSTTIAAIAA